jgi:hypothetical protein
LPRKISLSRRQIRGNKDKGAQSIINLNAKVSRWSNTKTNTTQQVRKKNIRGYRETDRRDRQNAAKTG